MGCQARTQRLCHTYGNGGEWGRVTPGMGMNRGRSTGEEGGWEEGREQGGEQVSGERGRGRGGEKGPRGRR